MLDDPVPQLGRTSSHAYLERSTAGNGCIQQVPVFDRPDALRRSGVDQVTGFERENGGHVFHELGDRENHISSGSRLPAYAVDADFDVQILRIADLIGRGKRAEGGKGVEALGDRPWMTVRFGLTLNVPGRHVESHGIGRYVLEGVGPGDVSSPSPMTATSSTS